MINIPKNTSTSIGPLWNQPNNSDVNGSLWASFNIDVEENEGKLRIGKRMLRAYGTVDSSDVTGSPVGFKFFNDASGDSIWTCMGAYVWEADNLNTITGAFSKDTNTGTPTDCAANTTDIEVFNGNLYVATASAVKYIVGGGSSWSTASGLGGFVSNSLCVYGNRLYCGGGSTIRSLDTGNVVASSGTYTLTLPDISFYITFLRASSNRIWIGTVNRGGGKGYIYEWDGSASQVTKSYRLEASGALSCVIKDDIPYVMDSNGNLNVWNGGTFTKLTGLNRRNNKLLNNPLSTTNNRFIHPNGMSIVKGKINMLIDGRDYDSSTASLQTVEETIPSGIYEYDQNKGLIHKYSIAPTLASDTITDYGHARLSAVGGLAEFNLPSTNANRNGTFLVGAGYFSDATTAKYGVFYDDSNDAKQKAGYFITTKIYAADENGNPSVQNIWATVYTLYKNLLNSSDKVVIKYRVVENDPIEATITWTATTTFTTTTNISAYWITGTGGEVEILNGIGSGRCSHIISIVNNAGTYTVTVDETYTGATGTAKARFQSWIKRDSISYNNSTPNGVTFQQSGFNDLSNWIQFKVWMLFTGKDEIEKMIIINANTNPAN